MPAYITILCTGHGHKFMKPIDYVALIIIAVGFALVISATTIVRKFNLAEKQECKHAEEMTEEEINNYKINKATFNLKIIGLVITIPGIVLLLVFNR